ncbi:MAG: type II secretion system protein GspL [Sulfurifustaceae bacterium]
MKKKVLELKDRLLGQLRALNATTMLGTVVEIRLPRGWPEADPSVYWCLRSDPTAPMQSGHAENVSQLPLAARAAAAQIWTPPGETLLTRATIPTRSRARILQALPFALEDQLLDEPENLQFAYVREADGTLAVAVTQRSRVSVWLEILKGSGVRATSLTPAMLALPLDPQTWSAAFVDGELWVRSGDHAGFVSMAALDAPPPLLVAALKEAAERGAAPTRLALFEAPATLDPQQWSAALQIPVTAETGDFWQHARRPALNLLQSDVGPTTHLQQVLRPLRPAAIMLALWVVAMIGLDVAEWIRLRRDHNAYNTEMREIYQRSFGSPAQFPYEQMQKGIDALQARGGGPADLLPLLARIAPALQAQQERAKLQGIKYNERSLTLELTLPDYQTLDAMKNSLQAASLDVEVLAANARGSEVEGRLRIQPGGSKPPSKQRS